MAEEAEAYLLTTSENQKLKSSRGYTGKGLALYSNQDTYEGDFLDGVRSGKGKYIYQEKGDWYEGDFKNNVKHGIGKYYYKDKGEYFGHFENGKRHGEGVMTYINKDIYKGWFIKGQKQGQGVYEYKDTGIKLQGMWESGQIKTGTWQLPDGTYYQGKFTNNKPNDQGTWFFRNQGKQGNILNGKFTQKKVENEDNPDEKPQIKLDWQSEQNLYQSAVMVNSHEKF